MPITKRSQI